MLEDGILVAEQSLIQQLKWLSDLQYSTLVITGPHTQMEGPNLIFVSASHQTGLDTKSKTQRSIIVEI